MQHIICKICGKERITYQKNAIYCSRKCMASDEQLNIEKRKVLNRIRPAKPRLGIPWSEQQKISHQLAWNKRRAKGLTVHPNSLKNLEIQKGETAWNWKGGVKPLYAKVRNMPQYKVWRKTILDRDKRLCRLCNLTHPRLEVDHHPLKFAEIMWKNNIKSCKEARECKELWDINNGRTLCKPCHFHLTNITYARYNHPRRSTISL